MIDSKLDLALAVNATVTQFSFPPLPHEQIYSYIGHGAPRLVRQALGLEENDPRVEEGLAYFLRTYREHMLDNTVAYPGVREGLAQLHAAGRLLTVLTNKPERISRDILRGLDLADSFRLIYGGNSFERKKPDPIGIATILRETGESKEQALVVGDSEIDVETARNAGVPVCGVTYGLGSHALQASAPDLLVSSLTELATLVCGARL